MTWSFYAVLSAAFAALVAVFGKIGISKVDTTLATTIRALIMAGFFVIVALAMSKGKLIGTIDRHALLFIVLSGLAGALSWLFYFMALKAGPTSAVAAIDRTSVAIVFILAVLFLGEKFQLRTAAGAMLVVGGAILMTLK
ncbi:MAG: EamA family transporter [Candidatus Kerfeldbacteria bacterium]|nr:EamA family transporter [Candidatus Kerfeldbacteria bacterium]